MFCRNCGAACADGAKFCPACGTDLSVAAAPVEPVYQQPVQPVYEQPVYQQPVYQQPVYQQPVYQQPYQAPVVPGKGLGIASMVLGIIALVLFCVLYIAIPCAIIGAILGGVAMNKAKQAGVKNGMGVAGLTCSLIALGVLVIYWILVATVLTELAFAFGGYYM